MRTSLSDSLASRKGVASNTVGRRWDNSDKEVLYDSTITVAPFWFRCQLQFKAHITEEIAGPCSAKCTTVGGWDGSGKEGSPSRRGRFTLKRQMSTECALLPRKSTAGWARAEARFQSPQDSDHAASPLFARCFALSRMCCPSLRHPGTSFTRRVSEDRHVKICGCPEKSKASDRAPVPVPKLCGTDWVEPGSSLPSRPSQQQLISFCESAEVRGDHAKLARDVTIRAVLGA